MLQVPRAESACDLVLGPKVGFAGAMFAMNMGRVPPSLVEAPSPLMVIVDLFPVRVRG